MPRSVSSLVSDPMTLDRTSGVSGDSACNTGAYVEPSTVRVPNMHLGRPGTGLCMLAHVKQTRLSTGTLVL